MAHDKTTEMKWTMVVLSTLEEWSLLSALLQEESGNKINRVSVKSAGSRQEMCDVSVDGRLLSLLPTAVEQATTRELFIQALDKSFKTSVRGISMFLLLIQGGRYSKEVRRMTEVLQSHFGAEVFKFLLVLSLEGNGVVDVMDDGLLELMNVCDGRYCRFTGSGASVSDELGALLQIVEHMLSAHGAGGYTERMLSEAQRRSSEDAALEILKQKLSEAELREEAFKEKVQQREESRAREMEEVRYKHAEERRAEATERGRYKTKRESLEEALRSHIAVTQLQLKASNGDNTENISIVLLGLSGSGKTSAADLILQRAGKQYPASAPGQEAPHLTAACRRRQVPWERKRLVVVDTPELWDEDGTEKVELVRQCLALAFPGPHAFLLVFQVGRFTQGESEMAGQLQKILGQRFTDHAVVLFTRCEENRHGRQSIEDYVAGAHATLQDLIQKCGSRFYVLDVGSSWNALSFPQVKELLSGVRKLVASHGSQPCATRRASAEDLREWNHKIEDGY